MSRTVRHKGNIKVIPKINNETLEKQCKRILGERLENSELPSYYDSYKEWLLDTFYNDEYYVRENDIYSIEKEELDHEFDIFDGNLKEDGSIDFHVMYYNGGCCLTEALDEVMKKQDTK